MGPQAGAIAYLCGAGVRLALTAWWSRASWAAPPPHRRTWREQAALMRDSAPLALATLFLAGFFRVDVVVLHAFQGERAVGLYAGGLRVFEALALLVLGFRSALFPVAARATDPPDETLGALCRRTLRLQILLTLGLAVFLSFNAGAAIRVALGPEYAPAAPALAILVWALPGTYMADTLRFLLAAQGRASLAAGSVVVSTLAGVALNLALVPRLSIAGAAATAVACEWLGFGVLLLAFRRAVPLRDLRELAWRSGLAGGMLAAALACVSHAPAGPLELARAATATMTLYALLLVVVGAVRPGDLGWLRERLGFGRR
jgi:O-antigen/teichoic acid export membrane protein